MKQPTRKEIMEAAATSKQAKDALVKLFPDAFEKYLAPGELYSWGDTECGGTGLIVASPDKKVFSFVSIFDGIRVVGAFSNRTTKQELEIMLDRIDPIRLYGVWNGKLVGPQSLSSLSLKPKKD